MFIHDIIKIKYVREGFLPDYPYHLTSDDEMFIGFLNIININESIDDITYKDYIEYSNDYLNSCYFLDNYPCIDESLWGKYKILMQEIQYHINLYLQDPYHSYIIPNWVYAYMIGSVIGPNSNTYDIHDMLVMLNMDNLEDELTIPIYDEIYKISIEYVNKLPESEKLHRPPTLFGEPHVIKLLRLEQSEI